jgi:hypothetical protein
METALRTRGLAGFQLLDLQDFPGQGTALVGILDAFMNSKNIITSAEWKQSCNDVVLLLEFPKYCWANAETFRAQVVVANYSNASIRRNLEWTVCKPQETVLFRGSFADAEIPCGGLTEIGEITADLSTLSAPIKLTTGLNSRHRLSQRLSNLGYPNLEPFRIGRYHVAEKLTPKVLSQLQPAPKSCSFRKPPMFGT